jgi:hypothetical protein
LHFALGFVNRLLKNIFRGEFGATFSSDLQTTKLESALGFTQFLMAVAMVLFSPFIALPILRHGIWRNAAH